MQGYAINDAGKLVDLYKEEIDSYLTGNQNVDSILVIDLKVNSKI